MAALAWNVATQPEDEGREAIRELVAEQFPGETKASEAMSGLMEILVQRKRGDYAHVTKIIMDCQVTEVADGHEVAVTAVALF